MTTSSDDDAPLGDRLRGMAGHLDVDPVESVREIRKRISRVEKTDRTLFSGLRVSVRMSTGRKISLIEEDDGGWSAIDEEVGVASQGETRQEALANLDEAVELTIEAREDDTGASEPDAPWFDT